MLKSKTKKRVSLRQTWMLHVMLLPGNILMAIFGTYVLIIGALISFKNYKPALGFLKSKWCGFDNYLYCLLYTSRCV